MKGRMLRRMLAAAALLTFAAAAADHPRAQGTPKVQSLLLQDASGLGALNVTLESVEYLGRKALRLTKENTEDGPDGFAILHDTDFRDGTIEVDLAAKVTAPAGVRMPGFIGVAIRARDDASHYELFYLRPRNARADDQAMRNHSVQYSSEPGFDWYRLRRAWPAVYESYVDIAPDAWTHVKIEVAGRVAKLFVNNAQEPVLIVDGLKGHDLRGRVALWGYANQESYFSNLRITHAPPVPISNGSDVTGTWDVMLATDAGRFEGSLVLQRNGADVTGAWSGALGKELPVKGAWRDGYVELTFAGEWPKDMRGGPAPAEVTLAGWIDGSAAKGRGKIEDRADGQWSATKKQESSSR